MYTIYSKPNCPNCVTAEKLLEKNGLPFEVKKLGVDYDAEFLTSQGVRAVPYITQNERVIGGLKDLIGILK